MQRQLPPAGPSTRVSCSISAMASRLLLVVSLSALAACSQLTAAKTSSPPVWVAPPPSPVQDPRTPLPDWADWCDVRPLHGDGTPRIWQELAEVAKARQLNIIPFPKVVSPEAWPNATTLQTCKFVSFSPYYADGMGSQYSRMLKVAAWAHAHGVTYVHVKIDHIDHNLTHLVDQIEGFFNLGYGSVTPRDLPAGSTVCMCDHCGPVGVAYQSGYMPTAIAKMLRGSLPTLPPLPRYVMERVNIAVHIRRGDVVPSARFLADGRWTADDYYIDVIRNMTRDLITYGAPEFEFHIYSQGLEEQFANISAALTYPQWDEWWRSQPQMALSPPPPPTDVEDTAMFPTEELQVAPPKPPLLNWRLNEDELTDLRGMMCADIFVMSSSSFSALSYWYSSAEIVVQPHTGWHPDFVPPARNMHSVVRHLDQRLRGRRYVHVGC